MVMKQRDLFLGDFGRGLGLVGDLEGGCHDFHWDI